MRKNKLGRSDLYISEIGLGCMSLGTDTQKARDIMTAALDQGINYLDTADLYDFGVNEEIVGAAIKGKREDVIVATKVGNRWESGKDGWFWDPSKTYIKAQVKQSLRRLGLDYLDLYQLHGGTLQDPIDETIEAFEELVQEGVIRYYGISSIRPNVIREYVNRSNIVSVMMQYSIFDRRPEEDILPLLAENNISVVARGPLAKGLLTDQWREKFPEKGYLDYTVQELESILPKLEEALTGAHSLTAASLQYCLKHPAVAAVIPGASRVEQVLNNAKAARSEPLTDEAYGRIQQITKASCYKAHR